MIRLLLLLWGALFAGSPARAQPARPPLTLQGQTYVDYAWQAVHPDTTAEGIGVVLRRLYVRADAALAPRLTGRLRLETNSERAPSVFIYHALLRWEAALGTRQNVTLGLQSLPLTSLLEAAWGYRYLSRVLPNRVRAAPATAFGLTVSGPLGGGRFQYAATLANRNGFDTQTEAGLAALALEARPGGGSRLGVGGHLAWQPEGTETAVVGVAGWAGEGAHAGLEGLYQHGPGGPDRYGWGLHASAALHQAWRLIARLDWHDDGSANTYGLVALAYRPHPALALTPNAVVAWRNGGVEDVLLRGTLFVAF